MTVGNLYQSTTDEVTSAWLTFAIARRRNACQQITNLLLLFFTASLCWKFACICSGTESPVVVVLSDSMRPGFARGDVLLLCSTHSGRNVPFHIGEIVVWRAKGVNIPIVHRVVERHTTAAPDATPGVHQLMDGEGNVLPMVAMLTKGDSNVHNDRGMYNGQKWLQREDIVARCYAIMPLVGYFNIYYHDYTAGKYIIIVLLALAHIAYESVRNTDMGGDRRGWEE
jgi:signal peptidase